MRKEFTFHTSDGTGLYMVQDVTAPPKAAVIIVHGLCEHLGRYEYLTGRLCERNLMVYRFDTGDMENQKEKESTMTVLRRSAMMSMKWRSV